MASFSPIFRPYTAIQPPNFRKIRTQSGQMASFTDQKWPAKWPATNSNSSSFWPSGQRFSSRVRTNSILSQPVFYLRLEISSLILNRNAAGKACFEGQWGGNDKPETPGTDAFWAETCRTFSAGQTSVRAKYQGWRRPPPTSLQMFRPHPISTEPRRPRPSVS